MKIRSLVFADQQPIPAQYTCNGPNINPPLSFENIPPKTQSLALIMHDPDAPSGDFTHWLVWNMEPSAFEIDEGKTPENGVEGITDFGKVGYGGPCPPSGRHRYFFELYALDTTLPLTAIATRVDLEAAMRGYILEQATLVGVYEK